ncbi:MAG: hypothetical protein JWN54_3606 [Mycobacterium sp.]|nr:hypothetical protein [Mycobacterium sp.]
MSVRGRVRPVYEGLLNRLPDRLAARIDFRLRRGRAHGWGGPLNGQVARRAIVEDLVARVGFVRVVETGTYLGTTTKYLAGLVPAVLTVEAVRRHFEYARLNLAGCPSVGSSYGDSRSFLRRLAADPRHTAGPTLCYLDAHWAEDLPLTDELRIIAAAWRDAVVMIDDFEVPGDAGYGFDDYGPGRRLSGSLLPRDALAGWAVFYPAAAGSSETGARRGSAFVVSPSLTATVGASPLLRRDNAFGTRP